MVQALHLDNGNTLTLESGGTIAASGITFTLTSGKLIVAGLPTTDPHTAGALWNNVGVVTISAG